MSKSFSHNDRPPKPPKDLSHIRLAGEADEMQIFLLFSLMHAEVGIHPLSFPKVATKIRLATQRQSGIIGVIGEPHDIKAALLMVIDPVWYSDDFMLQEYFNYVRPDARRSTYAQDLLAYGRYCADALHIPLTCAVTSKPRTEAKCRLYRRMIPKIGEFFQYRPEPQAIEMAAE